MTYPIYLLHFSLGSMVLRINSGIGRYAALCTAVAVILLLSWVVVKLEKPFRKTIERLIDLSLKKIH